MGFILFLGQQHFKMMLSQKLDIVANLYYTYTFKSPRLACSSGKSTTAQPSDMCALAHFFIGSFAKPTVSSDQFTECYKVTLSAQFLTCLDLLKCTASIIPIVYGPPTGDHSRTPQVSCERHSVGSGRYKRFMPLRIRPKFTAHAAYVSPKSRPGQVTWPSGWRFPTECSQGRTVFPLGLVIGTVDDTEHPPSSAEFIVLSLQSNLTAHTMIILCPKDFRKIICQHPSTWMLHNIHDFF